MKTQSGPGDVKVANDLYRSAALAEISSMRREGVYVCIGNVLSRMPKYNHEMLNNTLWSLAIEGLMDSRS